MSKKKIYIILAIILSIFIIAMIVITVVKIRSNKDSSSESSTTEYYAQNDVKDRTSSDVEEEIVTKKVVDNVVYDKFDELNIEQRAAKDGLIKLVRSAVKPNESTHGDAIKAEILDKSNDYFAFVLVTFLDDYTEEYVLVYDDVNTHSYLNCVTLALYENINGKIDE